jgi:hypothetical protein
LSFATSCDFRTDGGAVIVFGVAGVSEMDTFNDDFSTIKYC